MNLKEQTIALYIRLEKESDRRKQIGVCNKICSLNIGLARRAARKFKERSPLDYDDLVQESALGMHRAIPRYNYRKGVAFSSFIYPYCWGGMQHYQRDRGRTIKPPRDIQEGVSDVLRMAKKPEYQALSEADIARLIRGWSDQEWQQALSATNKSFTSSLDVAEEPTIRGGDDPLEVAVEQDDRDRLHSALERLLSLASPRTQQYLRCQLEGLQNPDIAKLYGVRTVDVSREIDGAIAQFREVVAA